MLIVMAGLPGTGKSTIARALAERIGATWLRIDSIETALGRFDAENFDIGPLGYFAAYAVAQDNLKLGRTVIADSVNPVNFTRTAWHDVARRSVVPCHDIEIVCSDTIEHQRRVETRVSDIEGLQQPSWADVQARAYEVWTTDRLVLDTARTTVDDAVEACIARLADYSGSSFNTKL